MDIQDLLSGTIKFSKLHAAGNDFICIDNTSDQLDDIFNSSVAQKFVCSLTSRGIGVGADGVLVACRKPENSNANIEARFLEPDGSEAHLCGNGTACFSFWARRRQLVTERDVYIHTKAGIAHARTAQDCLNNITVCVPDPKDLQTGISLQCGGEEWNIQYVNTGVPHAVVFCEDIKQVDVDRWGRWIRNHDRFAPEGVNVDFVQVVDEGNLSVRTYEFGVEGETLACGTGAVASSIIAAMLYKWPTEYSNGQKAVKVGVKSGENLDVRFVTEDFKAIRDVCLETQVTPVYDGTLDSEFFAGISG